MTTKTIASVGLALILTALSSFVVQARGYGACDGYHRCRCGVTAANYNGVALNYNGFNLKRAVEWVQAFPRTAFQSGVVGYVRRGGPSGHVFTVVDGSDCAKATVHDDRGTYTRNVCNATFVAVRGGGSQVKLATLRVKHSAKPRKHGYSGVQMAHVEATVFDRHGIH